jgi:lipopolysaccharide export LptBFGC system permease protein LptF
MEGSGWVFLAIALTFVGGGIAYAFARRGRTLGAAVWCSSLALVGVVLLFAARAASGWDGLSYLLVDLLFVAPAFVGSSIGLAIGIGVARRERARVASVPDES